MPPRDVAARKTQSAWAKKPRTDKRSTTNSARWIATAAYATVGKAHVTRWPCCVSGCACSGANCRGARRHTQASGPSVGAGGGAAQTSRVAVRWRYQQAEHAQPAAPASAAQAPPCQRMPRPADSHGGCGFGCAAPAAESVTRIAAATAQPVAEAVLSDATQPATAESRDDASHRKCMPRASANKQKTDEKWTRRSPKR